MPGPYGPLFDSETDNYVIYEDRGNNELRFKVVTSSSAERPGIPGADITAGEWIHVVGVYDGANAMIYLNGEKKDSHAITGTVKPGQIATLGKSGNTYFSGEMDQVEVYKHALSADEIMHLYKKTKADLSELNPSTVQLNDPIIEDMSINLSWSEAVNYESNIMGYEIYRSTEASPEILYATTGNVTEFADTDFSENESYYYRVKAKNTRGLLSIGFSNEVMAQTGVDNTRPKCVFLTSPGTGTEVVLEFNEAIEITSAENIANYSIDNSVTISNATLALDMKTVILTTSELNEQNYTLTLNGIKDRSATSNQILANTKLEFQHKAASADLIAWYNMSELPIDGNDTLLIDQSTNSNDGITKEKPELTSGFLGNALTFDNTKKQFVQMENSTSFDVSDTMVSISAWIKLRYLPVEMPEPFGPVFDAQSDQYIIYADRWNKELRFKVATSAKAERPGIPNDDLVTGQWMNVFAVYDGSAAKIYLNGELKDSHDITGTVKSGIVPMIAKSGTTGTPAFFNGSIDDIKIYKQAFTEAEIAEIYENYKQVANEVCEEYDVTVDVNICEGETYTFPDGSVSSEEEVNVSILTSIYGCDSTITTNLSITTINNEINEVDGVITAVETDASYQWLDCDNENAAISGATNQSFVPTQTGNYEVEITKGNCVKTSDCIYVEVTNIAANSYSLKIYPNPNNGQFILRTNFILDERSRIELINSVGAIIYSATPENSQDLLISVPEAPPGLYVVRIISKKTTFDHKMVIK